MAHSGLIHLIPQYVYRSALPFAPKSSAIYKAYRTEAESVIKVIAGGEAEWPPLMQWTFRHLHGKVRRIIFSPNGKHFASVGDDRTLKIWETASGAVVTTVDFEDGDDDHYSRPFAFSPNGSLVASASPRDPITVWDFATGVVHHALHGPAGSDDFEAVGFTPDGVNIAGVHQNGRISVWDALSGRLIHTVLRRSQSSSVASLQAGGNVFLAGAYIVSLNMTTGEATRIRAGNGWREDCIVYSDGPQGPRIISAPRYGSNWELEVWAVSPSAPESHDVLLQYTDSEKVECWAISQDGTRVASAVEDGCIRVHDIGGGSQHLHRIHNENPAPVTAMAFSPDGRTLVVGGWSGSLNIWDVGPRNDPTVAPEPCHWRSITAVSFSPGGTRIATGYDDGTVRIWDADSGVPLEPVFKPEDSNDDPQPIIMIHFCSGENRIHTGSEEQAYICDLTSESHLMRKEESESPSSCQLNQRLTAPLPPEPYVFCVIRKCLWRCSLSFLLRELARPSNPPYVGPPWTEPEANTEDGPERHIICRFPKLLFPDGSLDQPIAYSGSRVAIATRYGGRLLIIETTPGKEVRVEAKGGRGCHTLLGRMALSSQFRSLSMLGLLPRRNS